MTTLTGIPDVPTGTPLTAQLTYTRPYQRGDRLGIGTVNLTYDWTDARWELDGTPFDLVAARWEANDPAPGGPLRVLFRTGTGTAAQGSVLELLPVETAAGVLDLRARVTDLVWVAGPELQSLVTDLNTVKTNAQAATSTANAAAAGVQTAAAAAVQDAETAAAQALALLGIQAPYISHTTTLPPIGPNGTLGTWVGEQGRVYGTVISGAWVDTGYGAALTGQPEAAALYARALTTMQAQPATYARARARIAAGQPLRVALWGDSRSEGADTFDGVDGNYGGPGGTLSTRPGGDAYAIRLERDLRTMFPALAFQNFSLGSRNAWMAQNPNYKATASEPADPSAGFTRPWSTTGKSWKDHVRDWNPDVVIFAHDINSAWSAEGVATYHVTPTLALLTEMQAWPSTPDVVLVAGHESTPATDRGGFDPRHVRAAARANREMARHLNLPLADAHRLYGLLRSGRDDDTTRTRVVTLTEYGTQFTGDTGSFGVYVSGSDQYLVHDAAVRNRSVQVGRVRDVRLEFSVTHDSTGTLGLTKWRQDVTAGVEYVLQSYATGSAFQGGQGGFRLYWVQAGVPVGLGGIDVTVPVGASIPVTVDAVGAHVFIRADLGAGWVTVFDGWHYEGQYDGAVGFAIDGNPGATWGNVRVLLREAVQARGWTTEAGLIGPLRVNPNATDGNGINHPNGYGHATYYHAAFGGVLSGLQGVTRPVSAEAVGTPALGTGWALLGGGWAPAEVVRAGRRVQVSGMIVRQAGAGVTIITLPVGFRPAADSFASVQGAPGQVPLQLYADGRVALLSDGSVGVGQWVSLHLVMLAP